MIRLDRVTGGYGETAIVKDVSLEVRRGEFFALLGPNGSGKTTLFQLVTANMKAWSGTIELDGKPLGSYGGKERAKVLSVLAQEEQVAFDFLVREIVMLGRYPHQSGWLRAESEEDRTIVEQVMAETGVDRLADVPFWTLSGGEKQRVLLARALAQQPQALLLDEPTNHLDIRHTFVMLGLLKQWQEERGLTVFAILHDLNVASLYADRIGLMHEGELVQVGDAHLLKNERMLEQVYRVRTNTQYHPELPKPQLFLTPKPIGDGAEPRVPLRGRCALTREDAMIHVAFEQHLRTLSNGVNGEGFQWARHFCNFYVDREYDCSDPQADMRSWLEAKAIPFDETVGMMTAVPLRFAAFAEERHGELEVWTLATAGVGNAVDAASELEPAPLRLPGTINVFAFVNGRLTDGAFVNALLTATEAKAKALFELGVRDPRSGTIATGTSTDAIAIAATQEGEPTPYAGTGTQLGKMIGRTVFRAVTAAIENTRRG